MKLKVPDTGTKDQMKVAADQTRRSGIITQQETKHLTGALRDEEHSEPTKL